jgi:hypothetical protein
MGEFYATGGDARKGTYGHGVLAVTRLFIKRQGVFGKATGADKLLLAPSLFVKICY